MEIQWAEIRDDDLIRENVIRKHAGLCSLYKIKERKWKQQSRTKWAVDGNRNTKYFHAMEPARERTNCIVSLLVNDELVYDPDSIKKEIERHFKRLCSTRRSMRLANLICDIKSIKR